MINKIIIFISLTLCNSMKTNYRIINNRQDFFKTTFHKTHTIYKCWFNIINTKSKSSNLQENLCALGITHFEDYIANNNYFNDTYLIWAPKINKTNKIKILFIIVLDENHNKKTIIKQILHSPYWNPYQYKVSKLKEKLIELYDDIDLVCLYEHDLRFNLHFSRLNLLHP